MTKTCTAALVLKANSVPSTQVRTDTRVAGEFDPAAPLVGTWRTGEVTSSQSTLRFEDAVSLRRVDERTVETTFKKDGKARSVATLAVSSDGQTMTLTSKSTGTDVVTTRVYRRQEPRPFEGDWKLNVAKSQMGDRPLKEASLRLVGRDGGMHYHFDGIYADGRAERTRGSNPVKKVGERAWLRETVRDGKVVATLQHEVSADGKTLTSRITSEQGK